MPSSRSSLRTTNHYCGSWYLMLGAGLVRWTNILLRKISLGWFLKMEFWTACATIIRIPTKAVLPHWYILTKSNKNVRDSCCYWNTNGVSMQLCHDHCLMVHLCYFLFSVCIFVCVCVCFISARNSVKIFHCQKVWTKSPMIYHYCGCAVKFMNYFSMQSMLIVNWSRAWALE